jgi:uncharacterized membrane protein
MEFIGSINSNNTGNPGDRIKYSHAPLVYMYRYINRDPSVSLAYEEPGQPEPLIDAMDFLAEYRQSIREQQQKFKEDLEQ